MKIWKRINKTLIETKIKIILTNKKIMIIIKIINIINANLKIQTS